MIEYTGIIWNPATNSWSVSIVIDEYKELKDAEKRLKELIPKVSDVIKVLK